jgi:hypothetical protein
LRSFREEFTDSNCWPNKIPGHHYSKEKQIPYKENRKFTYQYSTTSGYDKLKASK